MATKILAAAEDHIADPSPQAPVNSIVATASTAHDLDRAHRKAVKAAALVLSTSYMRSPDARRELYVEDGKASAPARLLRACRSFISRRRGGD